MTLPGESATPLTEAALTARVLALEEELGDLYRRRAGTMRSEFPSLGWCVGCGRNVVQPDRGEDTCSACLGAL